MDTQDGVALAIVTLTAVVMIFFKVKGRKRKVDISTACGGCDSACKDDT